jgi:hypothetical protein
LKESESFFFILWANKSHEVHEQRLHRKADLEGIWWYLTHTHTYVIVATTYNFNYSHFIDNLCYTCRDESSRSDWHFNSLHVIACITKTWEPVRAVAVMMDRLSELMKRMPTRWRFRSCGDDDRWVFQASAIGECAIRVEVSWYRSGVLSMW